MDKYEMTERLSAQKRFFAGGKTLDISFRTEALKSLYSALEEREGEITEALRLDLGKSAFESYMCEIGMVRSEISYMLKNIKRLSAEKSVSTLIAQFPSHSYVKPSPLGCCLIMSPWNYPLLLTLGPMVDAIAAGNTVVLKPSNYAFHTAECIKNIIESLYPPEYVTVVLGGREENGHLLELPFDHIFFTGSKNVGKVVMEAASRHLTPIILELGGKSPCIVDHTCDLKLAARRIVFGKFLNCGQTCVAPDYIYCRRSVAAPLARYIKEEIKKQFGHKPLENPNYGKIITERHYARLKGLISTGNVTFGGEFDDEALRIEPTLMEDCRWGDHIMNEEIFGPILPMVIYDNDDEMIEAINAFDRPLALYIFSNDKKLIKRVTSLCRYGGGCINDVVIHLATEHMGFGGVGESGMGSYHGENGFRAFSHYKSIVDKKTWLDLPMRYQPYDSFKEKLIRMFLK